jgi:hypothetical protein
VLQPWSKTGLKMFFQATAPPTCPPSVYQIMCIDIPHLNQNLKQTSDEKIHPRAAKSDKRQKMSADLETINKLWRLL